MDSNSQSMPDLDIVADDKKVQDNTITIKVVDDTNELSFKLKRNMPIKKVMDAYCKRNSKNRDSIKFLFDGNRLSDENTPESMEMEDGDVIDVVLEQIGGYTVIDRLKMINENQHLYFPTISNVPKLQSGTVALVVNKFIIDICRFSLSLIHI